MPMLFKHFDEIDANKDGKISKDEIVANMKKMHHKMDKINENGGDAMKKGDQQ